MYFKNCLPFKSVITEGMTNIHYVTATNSGYVYTFYCGQELFIDLATNTYTFMSNGEEYTWGEYSDETILDELYTIFCDDYLFNDKIGIEVGNTVQHHLSQSLFRDGHRALLCIYRSYDRFLEYIVFFQNSELSLEENPYGIKEDMRVPSSHLHSGYRDDVFSVLVPSELGSFDFLGSGHIFDFYYFSGMRKIELPGNSGDHSVRSAEDEHSFEIFVLESLDDFAGVFGIVEESGFHS